MERTVERRLGEAAAVLSIEQIPELAHVHTRFKNEALDIIESLEWQQGEFEPVPLPADPITAAERLLEAERVHGRDSREYQQADKALIADNRRALGEAYRKTTWEYFPGLVHSFDRDSRLFTANGRPLVDMASDGLRWDKHEEERQRLANECAEEFTYHEFADHKLSETHWALTISPCPDHSIDDPGNNYGYVPSIEKMMLRGVYIETYEQSPEIIQRIDEQAALPGRILDMDTIHQTLEDLGAIEPGRTLSKTELHGTRFFIDKKYMSGVLDFVELLDKTAGDGVFMGEWKPDQERDYAAVKLQGQAREWMLEEQARELSDYMIRLTRSGADHAWAAVKVENKLSQLLHKRASTEPRVAREAFDEATAKGYEEAITLDRQGQYVQADALRIKTQNEAPPAAYCGAGSCGLREATSAETAHAHSLGILGEIIAHTEGRGPCGHKTVLYNKKGEKVCKRCDKKELKRKNQGKSSPPKRPLFKKPAKNNPKKEKASFLFS